MWYERRPKGQIKMDGFKANLPYTVHFWSLMSLASPILNFGSKLFVFVYSGYTEVSI